MNFRDLPPLAALRAFEATARLASFKAAAAELFVTPTAISHQIRQLEAIVSVVLVADALADGLLVMPFDQVLAGDAYHFVCAPELDGRADVNRLRAWFRQAMAPPSGTG